MSGAIAVERSVGGFFRDAVDSAVRARGVQATEAASQYLVGILSEFAHPDPRVSEALARPVAFLLDEALRAGGAERFQRLRLLGDGILYGAGFFGDAIEGRGVDKGYVVGVGAIAYDAAGDMLRRRTDAGADENVFGELARQFARFVEVLAEVAETALAREARGDRGIVRLYERWLRTGSATVAGELGARGVVPVRGRGGVH